MHVMLDAEDGIGSFQASCRPHRPMPARQAPPHWACLFVPLRSFVPIPFLTERAAESLKGRRYHGGSKR
jgi:hypothetical protein